MANIVEIKKLYKSLTNLKNIKDPNNPNTEVDFSLMTEADFIKIIESKDTRDKFFKKYWGVLKKAGFNLGKYADFEKKYGTPKSTAGNGENIKKLIDIDDDIEETTNPNQGVKVANNRIRVFYNDGRFVSRANLNNINDKTNEITGIWYFVGNDNYQIKYDGGGNTTVIDFKSNTKKIVSDKPFTQKPIPSQTKTTVANPIIEKLIKIDNAIKKTKSPNQGIWTSSDKTTFWIFWSDGTWRERFNNLNNIEKQIIGKWEFVGDNNYKVVDNKGKDYYYHIDLPKPTGTTWNNVTFTLEDVLAGKAVLKRGMKGKAVEDLQKLMIQMNFSKVSKSGEPDGKYGKLTELSIRQFQGEMPYGEQDGKVGQRTLKRMYRVYNYDPDLEVDDEQPQMPLDGQNVEPQTSQPQIPAGGENTTTSSQPATQTATAQPETPVQTKKKPNITPDALNEGDIRKIVSKNMKSLVK
jgi:peptidoglycan hydrolase-like protein with peptidoglycan-binding domain